MNNSSPPVVSSYRWVILAIMWAAAFIGVAAQFQVAALAYQIIPDYNLTSGQYAMVLTAPMIAGIFLSFAGGALADRFGVKNVVSVGFVFSVAGVFFRYAANNFLELFILMFLAGISSAFLNTNVSKLLGAWFPREKMGTVMGLYFSGPGIGIGAALATSALFPSAKSAFMTAGIIMFVIWILWMAFIKIKPEGAPDLPVMPVTKYIGVAAQSKNVWLVGLALMFFMGCNMVYAGFLPMALTDVKGINPSAAGLMAAMITVGTIFGNLAGPALSDRLGKMKPFLGPVALAGALAGYLAWIAPDGIAIWILLALFGFLAGISSPLLMAFPMLLPEIGPVYAGSAGGIIGTLQVVGAVGIPSFIIAPIAGENYGLMFALGSLSLALLAIVALFLPELGSKAQGGRDKPDYSGK